MNRLLLLFLVPLLVLGCNKNETPKPDESGLFVKFFGGAYTDEGFSEVLAPDGSYYLAGSTEIQEGKGKSILLVKIDRNGNKAWDSIYSFNDGYDEVAHDVILSQNGNLLIAGHKQYRNGTSDFLLLEVNKDNPSIYTKHVYGDTGVDEQALNLVQDTDGSLIIYGSKLTQDASSVRTRDMCVLKLNSNLQDTVWSRTIGVMSEEDEIGSLKLTTSGQMVWCGTVKRNSTSNAEMRLVLSDNFGNLIWDYGFNTDPSDNTDQFGYDMAVLNDGGYLVAGSSAKSTTDSRKNIFLVRTDDKGLLSTEHRSTYMLASDNGSQEALSVIAIGDNEFAITGYTTSKNGDEDVYVAIVDETGVTRSKTFGGAGNDRGHKIVRTADGGFLVIGTVEAKNNLMMASYKLNSELEPIP